MAAGILATTHAGVVELAVRELRVVIDESTTASHRSPVWRDKANFVIHADLAESNMPGRWEQLWVKKLDENHFQLCCIPFFAYGLALGDEVETMPTTESPYVVKSIVSDAGRTALRIALGPTERTEELARILVDSVRSGGCLFEWYTERYLAVDCALESPELAGLIKKLEPLKTERLIEYELSR